MKRETMAPVRPARMRETSLQVPQPEGWGIRPAPCPRLQAGVGSFARGLAPFRSGLAAMVAWGLLACAPAPPPPAPAAPAVAPAAPAAPAPAGPAALTPQRGGTLPVGARPPPVQLNPLVGGTVGENIALTGVFQALLRYDVRFTGDEPEDYTAEYRPAPLLAERWEQPDDKTYLFHLRKGAKWHDGQELTAEDVVWSSEILRDPANAYPNASILRPADKIEAVDRFTVRMTTKDVTPTFLQSLADERGLILPRRIGEGDLSELNKKAVGTGPFVMQSFDRNSKAILKRWDGYWDTGKPYLDGVEIIFGLDPSAIIAAVIAQEIDIHQVPEKTQADTILASNRAAKVVGFPGNSANQLDMRLDQPPYGDIRVRRAIHLAVSRQEMIQQLTGGKGVMNPPAGLGTKTGGWGIPLAELETLPGYRANKEQDLAEAKRLMAEAGYPNGFKTTVIFPRENASTGPTLEAFSGQVRKIGLEMELRPMERAVFNDAEAKGAYEARMTGSSIQFFDRELFNYFRSGGSQNATIKDPELDRFIDEQSRTTDQAKRKQLITQMQRLLVDNVYVIPTVELVIYAAWQPWLHQYVYNRRAQAYARNYDSLWIDAAALPGKRR